MLMREFMRFVSGHDFSRAVSCARDNRLQPLGRNGDTDHGEPL